MKEKITLRKNWQTIYYISTSFYQDFIPYIADMLFYELKWVLNEGQNKIQINYFENPPLRKEETLIDRIRRMWRFMAPLTMESCITLNSGCKAKLWRLAQSIGWFSNRTGTSLHDGAQKGLNSTSGAQFVALPLVKPVVWFARADVNWRSSSVAKSA